MQYKTSGAHPYRLIAAVVDGPGNVYVVLVVCIGLTGPETKYE